MCDLKYFVDISAASVLDLVSRGRAEESAAVCEHYVRLLEIRLTLQSLDSPFKLQPCSELENQAFFVSVQAGDFSSLFFKGECYQNKSLLLPTFDF